MSSDEGDFDVNAMAIGPKPLILYKYATMSAAKEILRTGEIFFRSPILFNDPFDGQWDPHWLFREEEARQACVSRYGELLDANVPVSTLPVFWQPLYERDLKHLALVSGSKRDEAKAEACELAATWYCKAFPSICNQAQSNTLRKLRVCCLSKEYKPILMWSHYADMHRGVAIGFDVGALEKGWDLEAKSVEYCPTVPKSVSVESVIGAASLDMSMVAPDDELSLCKSDAWISEQEWRFVRKKEDDLGDQHSETIPKGSIRELIFGCRSDADSARHCQMLARGHSPDCHTYEMRKAPRVFSLSRRVWVYPAL